MNSRKQNERRKRSRSRSKSRNRSRSSTSSNRSHKKTKKRTKPKFSVNRFALANIIVEQKKTNFKLDNEEVDRANHKFK